MMILPSKPQHMQLVKASNPIARKQQKDPVERHSYVENLPIAESQKTCSLARPNAFHPSGLSLRSITSAMDSVYNIRPCDAGR